MPVSCSRPPWDAELEPLLAAIPPADVLPEGIPALRKLQDEAATLQGTLKGQPFLHHESTVDGPHGSVPISVFTPKTPTNTARPAIFFIHGGGMICGNRFTFLKDPLRWAAKTNALLITVEYRQAPEHPFPAPHDDCWAALSWVGQNAASMGFDASRLLLAGQSAGGNLAASLALRARDIKDDIKVKICGVLVDAGMLDDRMTTPSSKQYDKFGTWTRGSNITAWNAYLSGTKASGSRGVNEHAAPSRATDLSGLPPTFVSVGSSELFRDENIDFASRMYASGGDVELHVWPGGYHCFDQLLPDAALSKQSIEAKVAWVQKLFARKNTTMAQSKL